jgi:hypothetical protein
MIGASPVGICENTISDSVADTLLITGATASRRNAYNLNRELGLRVALCDRRPNFGNANSPQVLVRKMIVPLSGDRRELQPGVINKALKAGGWTIEIPLLKQISRCVSFCRSSGKTAAGSDHTLHEVWGRPLPYGYV